MYICTPKGFTDEMVWNGGNHPTLATESAAESDSPALQTHVRHLPPQATLTLMIVTMVVARSTTNHHVRTYVQAYIRTCVCVHTK